MINRFGKAIDRASAEASKNDAGLMKSERILFSLRHFGYLQYWRSVEEMLAWTHAQPHTEWWKKAVERQRAHGDLSIYHETYVASARGFEAIYVNLGEHRPGASAFGDLRPPKGSMATARGRLGEMQEVRISGEMTTFDSMKRSGPSQ